MNYSISTTSLHQAFKIAYENFSPGNLEDGGKIN